MTSAARIAEVRVDPLDAFALRCQVRAYLFAAGEIDLHEAVDELQAAAVRDGLVKWLGGDAIKQITIGAFMAILGGEAGHA